MTPPADNLASGAVPEMAPEASLGSATHDKAASLASTISPLILALAYLDGIRAGLAREERA